MTYENCLKYVNEAKEEGNEEMVLFWEKRLKRKYPDKVKEEVEEEEEPKPKKTKKKVKG